MTTTSRGSAAPPSASASRSDRDRLRDYYGLADTTNTNANAGSSSSSSANPISPPPPASPSLTTRHHTTPSATSTPTPTTLPHLLSHHSSLLTSMRELDGDRQSLVYNHHGDLVAASQTMERLRDSERSGNGGRGLEESLGALRRSTEALGKWEGQLRGMLDGVGRRGGDRVEGKGGVDVAKEVLPIVTLPQRLRDVAALRGPGAGAVGGDDEGSGESVKDLEQGLAAAEALWGRHESILSTWSSQGVQGASAVADECRGVLREQRERVAEATATMAAVGSSPMARRREQQQQQQLQGEQAGVGARR